MGDNFDSIIYIIITIVAIAVSLFGKKKKKSTNGVHPLSNENQPEPKRRPFLSNLEQLLKEEIGVNDQDYQHEYDTDSINDTNKEYTMKEEVFEKQKKETIKSDDKVPSSIENEDTNKTFSNSIQDGDLTKPEGDSILKDINLRDAVIYSEIINRKKY
ncbi:MAG: hypothetical protein PF485_05985 [Bacteroidales bacterium]|jgi:hypothetical protein|nr:hypothetical protein [Bacteroidales bacterium]